MFGAAGEMLGALPGRFRPGGLASTLLRCGSVAVFATPGAGAPGLGAAVPEVAPGEAAGAPPLRPPPVAAPPPLDAPPLLDCPIAPPAPIIKQHAAVRSKRMETSDVV